VNVRIFCAVAVISLVSAACGGGNGSMSGGPVPCPLEAGANAIPAPPDLLYPMPNAADVPDGNFTMVAGYGPFAPPIAQIVPNGGGATVAAGAWGPPPSPLPSPAATPRSSMEMLYGARIPSLAASTSYSVQVTVGTPPCQTTETAGSFTTQ
jgi:hypothetical protein